ncbi:MAG TPA: malto-oligosyltrehalose trehalohydrolase [Candidatus Sulfotelmatobacter sp.]|nr:malto-oligosyltrehalose trehalohydrolase [Candidatus Sulfotelmatobacter sp.]
MKRSHGMPFGAEVLPDGTVRFRLWAPKAQRVTLCVEAGSQLPLAGLEQGWFELITREAGPGVGYQFQIDGQTKVPDPASRFQPSDVHGPSLVVDPLAFDWTDTQWRGRPWEEAVVYELHVGTFSPEGTFRGIERKLDYLHELGVTAVELMPVADFPGKRNWGYDGVLPFAPDSCYGRPEDLKQLVQAAHAHGLMIFLDVVYNHFGPDGNYLHLYAPQFFTNRHHTPWGDAINFDGPDSRVARDYFLHNALYWLEEYHFDGLRLDAVHAIADDSTPDILTELARSVRERLGKERFVHLILENGDNSARYLRRDEQGGVPWYDAQWNDDIHHCFHVLLTGESDGYYSDYAQAPDRHLCRCLAEGFAYQGDYSEYHGCTRGEPSSELPPTAFISFLQNHDQVGNRAFGERILKLAPPRAVQAAMEILLLAPSPPLLFMGEEFGAVTPFLFFCDFSGDLAAAVTNGRRNEFARFAKFNSAAVRESIPDPNAEDTFRQSKLDWECQTVSVHRQWLTFYRELLGVRQRVIVPHLAARCGVRCQFSGKGGRELSMDWLFDDGARLELRANLRNERVAVTQKHSGVHFYCSGPDVSSAFEQGWLPGWSVVWLRSGQRAVPSSP